LSVCLPLDLCHQPTGLLNHVIDELMARNRLGIISGSGPDAGVQLWETLIRRARETIGARYRGDVDSPHVAIISDPVLGYSMDLQRHEQLVTEHLGEALLTIDKQADVYAIACVTLHALLPKLDTIKRKGTLISVTDSIVSYAKKKSLRSVAVISAESLPREKSVLLQRLSEFLSIEVPTDPKVVHALVMDIKRLGGTNQSVVSRFQKLVNSLNSETVILACTDLPLVKTAFEDRTLINCTELIADSLIEYW
jgi:aspartate racemase